MTKEQLKVVNNLQAKIDTLASNINNYKRQEVRSNKNSDYKSIIISLNDCGNIDVKLYMSEEKHTTLINLIVDALEAELTLLQIEMDTYILSKTI